MKTEEEIQKEYLNIQDKVQSILPHNYYKTKISDLGLETIDKNIMNNLNYTGLDNLGKFIEYLVLFRSTKRVHYDKFENEQGIQRFYVGVPKLNGRKTVVEGTNTKLMTLASGGIYHFADELSKKGYIPSELNEIYNVQFRDKIPFKNPLMNQK